MKLTFFRNSLFLIFLLTIYPGTSLLSARKKLSPEVTGLKTESYTNPVGIDRAEPRFSWVIKSGIQNTLQTAFQVQTATSKQRLESGNLYWDSGKTQSGNSIHNKWEGPALNTGQRYYWRVRIWDNHGNVTPWSETAFWEMGLLEQGDWQALWVEPGFDDDPQSPQPAPMMRSEFTAGGRIKSARAYITAHGLYELYINGHRVGTELFTPGWTSYHNRLQYQTYDVTGLITQGENAVGVYLGDGWFRGYMGRLNRNNYGKTLALLAQIIINYEDGSTGVFGTGGDWKSTTGPILWSDLYNGEYYDARLEKEGWSKPGYDDGNWKGVRIADHGTGKLIAQQAPPVLKIQELKPVAVFTTPGGDTVLDMGQNMIGWIKLRVEGPAGTAVRLRHAEVLDRDGNFYTENLRTADQTNTYILKGGGVEVWEPRFTFQGFRYLAVDGYPGEILPENFTGVIIHSDMEPTGHFQCSHPLVNHLQHNIVWGQKGNFLDVPTDCPQRDERKGWTGDIQVFAPTANINMNTLGFLAKWLGDLAADQNAEGSVPHIVPNVHDHRSFGSAGWADAALIVPWSLYRYFGDAGILETQYESMKAWVEFMRRRAAGNHNTYLWDTDFSFGDWLSYSTSSDAHYPGAYTDYRMIATMFFAHSTDLLRKTAEILGKENDAKEYGRLFEKIRESFLSEYVTPGGRVLSDTQTSYILALAFNLLPDEMLGVAVDRLAGDVRERGHLTTGFLGTPYLNPILSRYGHHDAACRLLLRERYPSWLYPVTMGATTIWERWDGIKPDGLFQSAEMNSFNHYAYGAIGEWLFEEIAGIKPAGPGYKTVHIEPSPGGGLSHARAIINSVHGRIESSWELTGELFTLHVEIPANVAGRVKLPEAVVSGISGNLSDKGIHSVVQDGTDVLVQLGSGSYTFTYPSKKLAAAAGAAEQGTLTVPGSESTIGELLAVKQSREILYRNLPELTGSPWLSQVMGFTLGQAMHALPHQYRADDVVLERIGRELGQAGSRQQSGAEVKKRNNQKRSM
jgi:alpha-L-rhamnosidase